MIVKKLFGQNSIFDREELFNEEELALQLVDHRVESLTPYNFIHVFGEKAGLSHKGMNLALYLISIAIMQNYSYSFEPSRMAAAAISIALSVDKQSPWSADLYYWTSYGLNDILSSRAWIIQEWRNIYFSARDGRSCNIYNKYSSTKKFSVATIEPLMH